MNGNTRQVTIGIKGFNPKDTHALTFYLTKHLDKQFVIHHGAANALIIRLDPYQPEHQWQSLTLAGQIPSIVVAPYDTHFKNSRSLRTPLDLNQLLGLIERTWLDWLPGQSAESGGPQAIVAAPTASRSQHWFGGPQDADYTRVLGGDSAYFHHSIEQFFYDPRRYFQGQWALLLEGLKSRRNCAAFRIETDIGSLLLNTASAGVSWQGSAGLVRQLAFPALGQGGHFPLTAVPCIGDPWSGVDHQVTTLATDDFVWRLALLTSRGRVPMNTKLHAPVRLLGWPNFTRLAKIPQAMPIAAQWHSRPLSLLDTAKRLELPCHTVFSVYSACQALDLIDHGHKTGYRHETAVAPAFSEGILHSFLGRLRHLSQTLG